MVTSLLPLVGPAGAPHVLVNVVGRGWVQCVVLAKGACARGRQPARLMLRVEGDGVGPCWVVDDPVGVRHEWPGEGV